MQMYCYMIVSLFITPIHILTKHSHIRSLNIELYSLNLKYLLMMNLQPFERNICFVLPELSRDQSFYENMNQCKIVTTIKLSSPL